MGELIFRTIAWIEAGLAEVDLLSLIFLTIGMGIAMNMAIHVVRKLVRLFPDEPYRPIKWYEDEPDYSIDDEWESPILLPWYAPRRDPNHPRYD